MKAIIHFPDGRTEETHICGKSKSGNVITTTFGTFVRKKGSWVHKFVRDESIFITEVPIAKIEKERRKLKKITLKAKYGYTMLCEISPAFKKLFDFSRN